MTVQHVLKLLDAGYTKKEIDALGIEEIETPEPTPTPTPEPTHTPTPEPTPTPTPEPTHAPSTEIDYDKLTQSFMKAFQRYNINQNQQPQTPKENPFAAKL